jgi:hypothetical protein
MMNSWLWIVRPREGDGRTFSQSPLCGREVELRRALVLVSKPEAIMVPWALRSMAVDRACWDESLRASMDVQDVPVALLRMVSISVESVSSTSPIILATSGFVWASEMRRAAMEWRFALWRPRPPSETGSDARCHWLSSSGCARMEDRACLWVMCKASKSPWWLRTSAVRTLLGRLERRAVCRG